MNPRYLKYDIIRITALSLVLIAHVSAYIVLRFPDPSGEAFQVGTVFNSIGAMCIEFFTAPFSDSS